MTGEAPSIRRCGYATLPYKQNINTVLYTGGGRLADLNATISVFKEGRLVYLCVPQSVLVSHTVTAWLGYIASRVP